MIIESLPTAPCGHHYEVEQVSKLQAKVWLVRDEPSPFLEKEIRTIYCFIRGSKNLKVHKPKNAKESYAKSFCEMDELKNQSSWSLHNPTTLITLFD